MRQQLPRPNPLALALLQRETVLCMRPSAPKGGAPEHPKQYEPNASRSEGQGGCLHSRRSPGLHFGVRWRHSSQWQLVSCPFVVGDQKAGQPALPTLPSGARSTTMMAYRPLGTSGIVTLVEKLGPLTSPRERSVERIPPDLSPPVDRGTDHDDLALRGPDARDWRVTRGWGTHPNAGTAKAMSQTKTGRKRTIPTPNRCASHWPTAPSRTAGRGQR